MRHIATFMLLIFSTAGFGQVSPPVVESNSWVVVIGAVKECPHFEYRILDARKLQYRDSVSLVGASINDLTGWSGKEIENELQSRNDLSPEILPDSLKVMIYRAALPPEVLKRIVVQATGDTESECHEPTHQHDYRPKRHGPYQGDGPDDITIEHVKTVA